MARDTSDTTPLTKRDELIAWFAEGEKPPESFAVGTEHEKVPFYRNGNAPVPYAGETGIRALLEGVARETGWEAIEDAGNLIGLAGNDGGAISLEPGGQFELSGAPLADVHATERELRSHLEATARAADPLGIGFLDLGMSPKWTREGTPVMPKSRYKIMAGYMPKVGSLGLDMMLRTATVQVNLDFSSEADMAAKMRVALALQPVATALFANSPFTDGRPNGFLSRRSEIWRDTDGDRTGMLPRAFEAGFGYEAYTDWLLDMPMYFVKRGETYHDVSGASFRDLMDGRLAALPGEEGYDVGLGEPCLHGFPRGQAQALHRDARLRCGRCGHDRRAGGVLGRATLRRCRARGGLGHCQGLEYRRARMPPRHRATSRPRNTDRRTQSGHCGSGSPGNRPQGS